MLGLAQRIDGLLMNRVKTTLSLLVFAAVSLVAFLVTNRLSALHPTECDQIAVTVHEHSDEGSIRVQC